MDLTRGDVAVITGGASGIGLGLAKHLGALGMRVAIADIEEGALESAKAILEADGIDVCAVHSDVSRSDSVAALRDTVLERFGAVHILFNNAGVGVAGDPWRESLSTWEWAIGVNLMGVVHGVQAFLPFLKSHGRGYIVNTASVAGLMVGFPGPHTPYCATKHAVVALTEGLRLEMERTGTGVGVSVFCPGAVRSNIRSSRRNWPDHLGQPSAPPAGYEDLGLGLEGEPQPGMDPVAAAHIVAAAIREDRFWILTDPRFINEALARANCIAEQSNPRLPQWALKAPRFSGSLS